MGFGEDVIVVKAEREHMLLVLFNALNIKLAKSKLFMSEMARDCHLKSFHFAF